MFAPSPQAASQFSTDIPTFHHLYANILSFLENAIGKPRFFTIKELFLRIRLIVQEVDVLLLPLSSFFP